MESVWARTVSGLTVGTQYRLSVWVASTYHTAPAILRFNLDGQQVGTAITAPTTGASCPGTASAPIWQQLSVTFTAQSIQVAINLQDTNLQPSGNDFAIDDIELVPVAGGIAVFKEDFEVLSDYQYVAPLAAGVSALTGTAPLWPEGTYTIITSPQTNHPLFCSFVDHTTGSGRMLVANGRGGKVASSPIRKLANAYRRITAERSSKPADSLKITLVTNQPIDTALADLIEQARTSVPTSFRKRWKPGDPDLHRLVHASGLKPPTRRYASADTPRLAP